MLPDSAFPPCMKSVARDLAAGAPVAHPARLAFASFMLKLGASPGEVVEHYSHSPKFDRAKTVRYVADLAQRDAMPYSCSNMKLHGVCKPGMPESLCASIRNPLSFGRIRSGVRDESWRPAQAETAEVTLEVFCQCEQFIGFARGREAAFMLHARHYWAYPEEEGERDHLMLRTG